MTPITFWFDPVSPYAALAFERLPAALAGCSCVVDYRPVLLAGLLKHWGQLGPAEIAPKRDWTYRQVLWLAHAHGVPLQLPAAHPFNPLGALRLALACGEGGRVNRFVAETVFRQVWRGGADAADPWPAMSGTCPIAAAAVGLCQSALPDGRSTHILRTRCRSGPQEG